MPLLHRSRATMARGLRSEESKQDVAAAEPGVSTQSNDERKKSIGSDRPKTADARASRSFSRPRTANATVERSVEVPAQPETIQFKSGNDTYNFPTPSPRLPPKSATFYYPPTPSPHLPSESPAIGVALGSPSQPPMPKWGRAYTTNDVWGREAVASPPRRMPATAAKMTETTPQRPDLKRKKSSWRALGDLFGRKPSKSAVQEPFYKVKVPHAQKPEAARSLDTPSPIQPDVHSSKPPGHHRTPSITRGMARFEARAQADLASFHPGSQPRKMRSPSMIQKEGFSPMFRILNSQRESEEMFSSSAHDRNDSPLSMNEKLALPRTPRLDLDLPNPGFDRYSIMFEKVLEDPKPSLLERRQSKMQRKKSLKGPEPITEENGVGTSVPDSGLQRSVSSPRLLNITSRLFIKTKQKDRSVTAPVPTGQENECATALNRPRPILRSNTVPSGSQSPLERAFMKATKTVVMGLTPTSQTFSISENSLPPTPMTANTISDRDSVAILSNDITGGQRGIDQGEPSWDMITSKPLSPEKRRDPYPRVKSPEELERQIVQVSVARQVSVTKARRQVQNATASKQPLRPRVVQLSKDKDRKSTMVVIESGIDE